jgi:4-hydroxy-3-methylbut-2-en-1-yl diphosphate synthase IspG/GcpE
MSKELPLPFYPRRRCSRAVMVGKVGIGGEDPVRVQSMLTCDTMDTAACVRDSIALADVGCEIVRITAPTVKDARNLEAIRDELRSKGCDVPLVADIHFKPEAALESAKWVEKVPIRRSSLCANTPTTNMRRKSAASARSSRRWSNFAKSAASPCASGRTTAR